LSATRYKEVNMAERSTDGAPPVMVIGGGSGIGRGVAETMLAAGERVVIVGRSEERLAKASTEIGGELATLAADITDETDVRALFERCGPLSHVLITAADIASYGPVSELDLKDASSAIDSKLLGAILIAKHAPPLIQEGGSITLTGGIAFERPAPGGSIVAAVNGALVGLCRALALELAPIRVNVLSPGWTTTPFWERMPPEQRDAMISDMVDRLPAGQIASPRDLGEAALFLTRARHVTGTVLEVNGGQHLA
jgi:NAD(P)-dependent dehydrogenase (short-subunit alcohol dehydrogenase family)